MKSFSSVLSKGLQNESEVCEVPQTRSKTIKTRFRFLNNELLPNSQCVAGQTCLVYTRKSKAHSKQHFCWDDNITSLDKAYQYSRMGSTTSILDKRLPLQRVINLLSERPDLIKLDKKAIPQPDSPRLTYEADLMLSESPPVFAQPSLYQFRIIVCNQDYCNNNILKTNVHEKNSFKRGDIISIFPVCGPLVLRIPPTSSLDKFMNSKEGKEEEFSAEKAGLRYNPCKSKTKKLSLN
jgi:hypothetical protein